MTCNCKTIGELTWEEVFPNDNEMVKTMKKADKAMVVFCKMSKRDQQRVASYPGGYDS